MIRRAPILPQRCTIKSSHSPSMARLCHLLDRPQFHPRKVCMIQINYSVTATVIHLDNLCFFQVKVMPIQQMACPGCLRLMMCQREWAIWPVWQRLFRVANLYAGSLASHRVHLLLFTDAGSDYDARKTSTGKGDGNIVRELSNPLFYPTGADVWTEANTHR